MEVIVCDLELSTRSEAEFLYFLYYLATKSLFKDNIFHTEGAKSLYKVTA